MGEGEEGVGSWEKGGKGGEGEGGGGGKRRRKGGGLEKRGVRGIGEVVYVKNQGKLKRLLYLVIPFHQ